MSIILGAIVVGPGAVISWAVAGLLAGWLAGVIMKRGYGVVGEIVVGVVGALSCGLFVGLLFDGWAGTWLSIVAALLGAFLLIALMRIAYGRQTALRL